MNCPLIQGKLFCNNNLQTVIVGILQTFLKSTFQRGTINVILPDANHVVWTDDDGLSYDINGVVNNTSILMPTKFLENFFPEFSQTIFRHTIMFKSCKITEELINAIIEEYKQVQIL